MAEYIERKAATSEVYNLRMDAFRRNDKKECSCYNKVYAFLVNAPAADVAPVSELKEFAEDVLYQFGYKINYNGGLHITAGGLSTLEWAFEILGWDDPKPYPEGECEWGGCHEYATCGTTTPDGYKRVCSRHYATIKAREEADAVFRMDGE